MFNSFKGQRLVALFILFFLLLGFPFFGAFGQGTTILGIPSLYFVLFSLWLVMIVCIFLVLESGSKRKSR